MNPLLFLLLLGSQPSPPDAVPAEARSGCATMQLLQASRAGAIVAAGVTMARPASTGFVDSADVPVRVHTTAGVDVARATTTLSFLQSAWQRQFVDGVYPDPLADGGAGGDDRLDVYLQLQGPGIGAITVAGDDIPGDGRHAASAFMIVEPRLDDDLLEVYLSHELQHASQFGVDLKESVMWFEATAVVEEIRQRPDVTEWQEALPAFQRQPHAPIFTDGSAFSEFSLLVDRRYEYGAALFALYLDEELGSGDGSTLAALWQASIQDDGVDAVDAADANEPDWLDALAGVTGQDAASVVLDFATWRGLVGPLAVEGDGPRHALDGRALLQGGIIALENLRGEARITTEVDGPFQLGCVIRSGDAPLDAAIPVRVRAESTLPDGVLGIASVVIVEDDTGRTATRSEVETRGRLVEHDVTVPAGATLILAICDLGAADADDAPVLRPIELTLSRIDVEQDGGTAVDAGSDPFLDAGTGETPPPGTCGCQSTTSSSGASPRQMRTGIGVAGMILGLGAFIVRALRARRRKALYRRSPPEAGPHDG